MRIACKKCKGNCCNNMTIDFQEGQEGINPNDLKKGDWLYIAGITFAKKANELWKCLAFDTKSQLCKIYKYRSPLCRSFQCKYSKKSANNNKLPVNYESQSADKIYKLNFFKDKSKAKK